MSTKTFHALYCDGEARSCPYDGSPIFSHIEASTIRDQRDHAKRQGWVRRGKLDYCYECKKALRKPKAP